METKIKYGKNNFKIIKNWYDHYINKNRLGYTIFIYSQTEKDYIVIADANSYYKALKFLVKYYNKNTTKELLNP
jgi:tRNA uridine 5-carbamoylmethylation protein Kti12